MAKMGLGETSPLDSTAMSNTSPSASATDALFYVRNVIFAIGPATALVLTTLFALQVQSQMTAGERVVIVVIAVTSTTAAFLVRMHWLPWLFGLALTATVTVAVVSPGTDPPWLPLTLLMSYLTYVIIVMSTRVVGLAAVFVGPLCLVAIWQLAPQSVIPGGLIFAAGSLPAAQLLFASGLLWLVWNRLSSEAAIRDSTMEDVATRTLQMIRESDRAQMWASSAKHLHETLLNTLGFLRGSTNVDSVELKSFLARQGTPPDFVGTVTAAAPLVPAEVRIDTPFVGRYLLTAPAVGNAMGSFGFSALILSQEGLRAVGPAVIGVMSASLALYMLLMHRPLSRSATLVIAMVPALMPWIFLLSDVDCTEALVAASLINFAGFTIIVAMIWGAPLFSVASLGLWGVGSLVFWLRLDPECRQFLTIALVNLTLLIPIVLVILTKGAKALEQSQRRSNAIRERELVAQAHALAWRDVQREFEEVTRECTDVISGIADGAPLDEAARRSLDACDTRLRLLLLADPLTLGAFGQVARALAARGLEAGIVVKVNSISGSADVRPLTSDVVRTLDAIVDGCSRLTIQVMTDGREDYLSMEVDRSALSALAGHVGSWGDTELSLEASESPDDDSRAVVLLMRAVHGT